MAVRRASAEYPTKQGNVSMPEYVKYIDHVVNRVDRNLRWEAPPIERRAELTVTDNGLETLPDGHTLYELTCFVCNANVRHIVTDDWVQLEFPKQNASRMIVTMMADRIHTAVGCTHLGEILDRYGYPLDCIHYSGDVMQITGPSLNAEYVAAIFHQDPEACSYCGHPFQLHNGVLSEVDNGFFTTFAANDDGTYDNVAMNKQFVLVVRCPELAPLSSVALPFGIRVPVNELTLGEFTEIKEGTE